MLTKHTRFKNYLLAALPDPLLERWRHELTYVEMKVGDLIYESDTRVKFIYFPESCIVSLLYLLENGNTTEISVVGFEGMVGFSTILGGGSTISCAVIQSAGMAYRVRVDFLKEQFFGDLFVRNLLLRFTQALMTQMTQGAVCNRHHTLEQRLCRWLLSNLDRLSGTDLITTQELISNMLGVRREGVTEAAGRLQKAGIISYARGHIKVIDTASLKRRSCECHAVVRDEYDRLLPDLLAA